MYLVNCVRLYECQEKFSKWPRVWSIEREKFWRFCLMENGLRLLGRMEHLFLIYWTYESYYGNGEYENFSFVSWRVCWRGSIIVVWEYCIINLLDNKRVSEWWWKFKRTLRFLRRFYLNNFEPRLSRFRNSHGIHAFTYDLLLFVHVSKPFFIFLHVIDPA